MQYSRKENIVEECADKHALPMVAVYLLGNAVRGMLSQGMDVAMVASLLGLSEEEACAYGG